jgi:hypothetical protein
VRRGVTLAEALIAVAVGCTVLAMLMTLWSSSRRYSHALEERFSALARGQVALSSIAREVQLARRIVSPSAAATEGWLAVLDARGDLVQIALERGDPRKPGTLVRRRVGVNAPAAPLLTGVHDVRFRVPGVEPGRDPALVHVTLTLAAPDTKPMYLVTSARVRAPVPSCPIER